MEKNFMCLFCVSELPDHFLKKKLIEDIRVVRPPPELRTCPQFIFLIFFTWPLNKLFFTKSLKLAKWTYLPNLVILAHWEVEKTKLIKYFQEVPKMGQLTSIPNLVILGWWEEGPTKKGNFLTFLVGPTSPHRRITKFGMLVSWLILETSWRY